MQSGKIRFSNVRELSKWRRGPAPSPPAEGGLCSLWTGLDFRPKEKPVDKVDLSRKDREILNRQTVPSRNRALIQQKTDICQEEKGSWATFKCEKVETETEGHTWRRRYLFGCKSPNCHLCQSAYATKRAREAWGRPDQEADATSGAMQFLNAANNVVWWYVVCTIPRQLRSQVNQERIKSLRNTFWRDFQAWALDRQRLQGGNYPRQDLQMGAFHVLHPVGDREDEHEDGETEEDRSGFHPHLNFIIPCMAFGSYMAPNGLQYDGKRLKHLLRRYELKELRKLWKNALHSAFGLEQCVLRRECDICRDGGDFAKDFCNEQTGIEIDEKGADGKPKEANIHISYRGKIGRTYDADTSTEFNKDEREALREQKHCLKYNFRSFPGWPPWTRRITRYGYLASRKIGKYRAIWEEWEPIPYSEPVSCKCGAEIELETDDPLAALYAADENGSVSTSQVHELYQDDVGTLFYPRHRT